MKPKMTLPQFISTWDSEDGGISVSWEKHWIETLPKMLMGDNIKEHGGDCTGIPGSCMLCVLENFLREYREYYFEGETE